jgi:transposase-like protein
LIATDVVSETAIMKRYRRREEYVEEALVEIYPAGVSVREASIFITMLHAMRIGTTKITPASIAKCSKVDGCILQALQP